MLVLNKSDIDISTQHNRAQPTLNFFEYAIRHQNYIYFLTEQIKEKERGKAKAWWLLGCYRATEVVRRPPPPPRKGPGKQRNYGVGCGGRRRRRRVSGQSSHPRACIPERVAVLTFSGTSRPR